MPCCIAGSGCLWFLRVACVCVCVRECVRARVVVVGPYGVIIIPAAPWWQCNGRRQLWKNMLYPQRFKNPLACCDLQISHVCHRDFLSLVGADGFYVVTHPAVPVTHPAVPLAV